MDINITHEKDEFSLYIDGKFHGSYSSPNEAAIALEEMYGDKEAKNNEPTQLGTT